MTGLSLMWQFLTLFIVFLSVSNVSKAATLSNGENHVTERISLLRDQMRFYNLSAYIITDVDEHQNDYIVSERDRRREWISGFSGLQGDVVVTMNKTALWTLGSLFYLAKQEVPSDWILMESCPSLNGKYLPLEVWLSKELNYGSRVGADPNVAYSEWNDWESKLQLKNITLVPMEENLIDLIWKDQPGYRKNPLYNLPSDIAGETPREKLKLVHEDMTQLNADLCIITDLSEIAWLTNMRGGDIPYVPVFRSYMLLGKDFSNLYLPPEKHESHINIILKNENITLLDYDQFWKDLKSYSKAASGILLPKSYNNAFEVSYKIYSMLPKFKIKNKVFPILSRKDKKNPIEIAGLKQIHLRDAIAMIQWMIKMENGIKNGSLIREIDAIESLREIRYEQKSNRGESSECIAGYGSNSANFFNIPKNKSSIQISTEKPFMITTGGRYDEGKTRLARTFHYGTPSEKEKTAYTALLAGIIDLVKLTFPLGTSACATDIVIQMPLYKIGQEFEYEAIQGFGEFFGEYEAFKDTYDLNVFRFQGIGYRQEREWGMLLKNVVIVVPANTTFQSGKQFMTFKMITLVPYERNLINPEQLTNEQLEWLNNYHKEVKTEIEAELSNQESKEIREQIINWLKEKTKPIEKLKSVKLDMTN
ncbi:xaa-Pro aminopeptidase 2-like [Leptopilina heterotoma]|uniref:xaa-Pro aminopeptidase 2-like n=1 Tax=Leptopilina heterotoma TaxID=63436 RepID=UPI001CA8BA26|nr:xaa-Pro aminopeptidase 2-like [Leptopilina heterotoma]XP_043463648.1 xaa-Pro aminopeptidase 2-like [Leptopilina heterotoma]XP_043463649.1 xaa-Pro aminopeptidase 2-like [Leptopilina heterotoma]